MPDHDQTLAIGVRKGLQYQSVDDAEDCSGGPDTQRERDDCNRSEAGVLSHSAKPVSNVVKQKIHKHVRLPIADLPLGIRLEARRFGIRKSAITNPITRISKPPSGRPSSRGAPVCNKLLTRSQGGPPKLRLKSAARETAMME